jgi:hypothetical protein
MEVEMDPMGKTVHTELEQNVEQLRALREEVRLKAHLAKMEAKEAWRELEPRVAELVDQAAKSASQVSRSAVTEAIHALEKLRDSMH